jgi:hypothetical protein
MAGKVQIDIGISAVTVQVDQESGDTQLLFANSYVPNLHGKKIESVYLHLNLAAQRVEESEHSGELLCLGLAPLTSSGILDDTMFFAEYSLLPGNNSTVIWDLTGLFRAWSINAFSDNGFGVFSCDENEEAYSIYPITNQGDIGWFEIRYTNVR